MRSGTVLAEPPTDPAITTKAPQGFRAGSAPTRRFPFRRDNRSTNRLKSSFLARWSEAPRDNAYRSALGRFENVVLKFEKL